MKQGSALILEERMAGSIKELDLGWRQSLDIRISIFKGMRKVAGWNNDILSKILQANF